MRRLALFSLLLASGAAAQPHNWVPVSPGDGVYASVQNAPGISGGAANALLFVGARREVVSGVQVEVEVPFVFVITSESADAAFGNPYVGASVALQSNARGSATVGAGIRPRLSPDPGSSSAAVVGLFSEVERLGMFQNDDLTFTAYADAEQRVGDGNTAIRIRLAPTLVGDDVFGGFAAQGIVDTRPARISAGVSGTVFLGETDGDRLFLFGGIAAEGQRGAVRPMAFLRVPLVSPRGFFGGAKTTIGVGVNAPF